MTPYTKILRVKQIGNVRIYKCLHANGMPCVVAVKGDKHVTTISSYEDVEDLWRAYVGHNKQNREH